MKRFPWFEVILIIVVMSISLYGAFADGQNFSRRWFTRDDAYYYFKVAQNISEGRGSTFDGINQTNGYHPLWMLICVPIFALARFDLILPLRILFVLMHGLSVATAILFYRLVGRIFAPAIGAIAALYWVFSLDILNRVYMQGLETGIAAFFIVLFVYKLYEFERSWRREPVTIRQLITLGIIGLCVILSRLDLVFFVALVGLWIVFRRGAMRYLLPLDIVSIAFSVLLAFVVTLDLDVYYKIAHEAVKMLVISLALKIPLAYLFGLYRRGKFDRLPSLMRSLMLFVVSSSVILAATMLVVARLFAFENFPKVILLYDAIITFVLLGSTRLILIGLKTASIDFRQDQPVLVEFRSNWLRWLQEGIVFYGVAFGGLAIYMLWNKFAFGTLSPVSGQIKRWWGSFPGRVYGGPARNIPSFFGISYLGDSNAWYPMSSFFGGWAEHLNQWKILDIWRYLIFVSLFALLFYAVLWIDKKKARRALVEMSVLPLLCGSWLQIFYYHMQGYSAYKEWYWITQLVLTVLVISLMLGMVYRALHNSLWLQRIAWSLAIAVGMYIGFQYASLIRILMTYHEWTPNEPHMDLAAFLEQHTEPGSIIGMTGGGNVGYFIHDRTVVNMDGLINSYTYFELMKNKEAGKYLADIGMNYIMANMDLLDGLPYRGQYTDYVEWMDVRYGGKSLVHYHSTVQP